MRRVLLVCSVHQPTGLATAAELHWLLGRLRPDVLFLEHSATDFAAFLDGSCGTLESAAVVHYRKLHPVELVPVGVHLDAEGLKQKFDEMFDRIEEASHLYCQLRLANDLHTARGGFAYLNSPTSALLQSEMQRELRATVEAVGQPALTQMYALWTRTNDLRELAMLGGVEAFAGRTAFEKGVFLVGSAHRQSLIEKSQQPRTDSSSAVTWDFEWELEEAANGDAGWGGNAAGRGALG